jgi:predicted 3-demethylubiquinone-9 3-methyltransferase (glyoxalase superfamily)
MERLHRQTKALSTCSEKINDAKNSQHDRVGKILNLPVRMLRGSDSDSQEEETLQKITPFLWFDSKAEEAANFYVSIFKNSKISSVARYGDAGPGPKGSVMMVVFQLEGQEFMALNGGPLYTFTPAISFSVNCKTQQEVDDLWDKLTAGGGEVECGWLRDKYGLSWQIIPMALMELMQDKDPVKSQRVFKAMLQMTKIDIEGLQRAYRGE